MWFLATAEPKQALRGRLMQGTSIALGHFRAKPTGQSARYAIVRHRLIVVAGVETFQNLFAAPPHDEPIIQSQKAELGVPVAL
jgi:hypothetical protein